MRAVLLIEGCATTRERIEAALAGAGFVVHAMGEGRGVVERADELRPLAILLDSDLPERDAICTGLRRSSRDAGFPILLLSASEDAAVPLAGLGSEIDDLVCKNASAELILGRLARLIRTHQLTTMSRLNEQLVQVGRLLAGVIHEIRGPLSVIRGNAEMMRLSVGDQHDCLRWIDPILRNAQLLQLRLEHLMAAVRAGPPVLVPIEVPPLVREAADLFLKGADPRGAKLCVTTDFAEPLPRVRADAGRLLQVLLNLLCNAQEAVPEGRDEVRITILASVRRDEERDWLTISVQDNGTGIPEPYLGRVFEPFFTTKPHGTGYGLYLASEILREHSGRLTAGNSDEAGACFVLWLPLEPGPATPAEGVA